jgi:diguanylate cyclase (GGDEF)-like protein
LDNFTTELAILDSHIDQLVNRIQVNDQKWKQFQKLETEFLYRTSLIELIEYSLNDSLSSFGLDAVSLVLLDNNDNELKGFLEEDGFLFNQYPGLILITDETPLTQLFGRTKQVYVGPFQHNLHAWLYPQEVMQTPNSLVILPLYRRGEYIGAMVLGSTDNDRFKLQLSTEFVERLALIIGVCFENAISIELLKRTSFIDPLTRINNRRYFDQRLGEEVDRSLRSGDSLSCLFLDIDFFKKVNDNYGHQIGDIILQKVAQLMRPQLRSADILARYGGEEFVAVITGASSQIAIDVATRIRSSIERRQFDVGNNAKITITASIGVATFQPKEFSGSRETIARALIGKADEALFEAKRAGRNQVHFGGVLSDIHSELVLLSTQTNNKQAS